ncbi:hypothetical protein [Photorhabdus antumapuensis]|uniref:hypothetical protein n=1 Tax=Photorhabdus antumapuensis TaxID=2862867 RepID=UPI001CED9CAD|nr:hypothetical protein [Photorhabdus antumapuensis]MCA6219297.1 hypothetical protein [Photorhabdus antumapuensis]
MHNSLDLVDAMNKIECLAAAAQFLTSNEEERMVQMELLSIIEDTARKAHDFKRGSDA